MIWPVVAPVMRSAITPAGWSGEAMRPASRIATNRSCSPAPIWAGGWARIQAGIAVSTGPGRTMLMVTPVPASSAARPRVWASKAALEAA
jgi:hypothetical protein